jgi:outer membrane protein assembly factor BamB
VFPVRQAARRAATLLALGALGASASAQLPEAPLRYGGLRARFSPQGTLTIEGQGWPSFTGSWRAEGGTLILKTSGGPAGCESEGQYAFRREGARVGFELVKDECNPRRMMLDRSLWVPADEPRVIPERRIARTAATSRRGTLPAAPAATGSWPSFRGPQASGVADDQGLPPAWDVRTGENVLWKVAVPGLAHSSPVIWGGRVFVTSAVSSRADASFRPGLYGDGDASADRTRHRFVVSAFDKRTGARLWDKRHVKSTYASASPATDGRVVVAWFGSQGVHAFDVEGNPLWSVDLGRLDLGAYDLPSFEWGPASSPVLWNGRVLLQCDTQADSFVLALDAATGETLWKAQRDELPSWGTPTVAQTAHGPELVTNASNFIRGYDPASGRELWRLGKSSKITAPTPVFADGLFVVASGRAPERPIFAVRPGARGDLTLAADQTSSEAIAWSRTGRGSYMPTPLAYRGVLYVLANNGVFDAYDLRSGQELYRQRLADVGSGFSASPVAADGRVYLSSEDGDVLVIAAGREFQQLARIPMGELLMATPALSEGALYVRSSQSLFAIGAKQPR